MSLCNLGVLRPASRRKGQKAGERAASADFFEEEGEGSEIFSEPPSLHKTGRGDFCRRDSRKDEGLVVPGDKRVLPHYAQKRTGGALTRGDAWGDSGGKEGDTATLEGSFYSKEGGQ